jgi:Ca-activated chloride channel family protein
MSRMLAFLAALAVATPMLTHVHSAAAGQDGLEVDARLGHSVLRQGSKQRVYLRVGLRGIHNPSGEVERAPVNVALVIDRSGSMNGNKMAKAKEAAIMAIERLARRDIASVVSFSNGVTVDVPAGQVRDHELVHRIIRSIQAGGSTAIFAAVNTGAAQVREFSGGERVDRIILLSDGLANVGPSDPYTFESLGRRLGGEGISVTTIGLGRGYNEDLMARLAGASDGNHDFAETADDLRRIFNREFDDVLSVIAQDIEIIIELPRGVRPLRSLGRDAEIAGNRAVFKVAQAYAKSTHSLQLELEVDADFALGEREMANVVVRYRPHGDATRTSQTANVRATFSADAERAARSIDPVVMDPVVELIAREKTRQAIQLRDEGRTKEARTLLHKAKKFIGYHNQNLEQFGHQRSGRMQALEQQYAKDAEAIAQRDWNVQRKSMRKGLGTAAGSSVKY